jgi:hypothetical protein
MGFHRPVSCAIELARKADVDQDMGVTVANHRRRTYYAEVNMTG